MSDTTGAIALVHPRRLLFGAGTLMDGATEVAAALTAGGGARVLVLTSQHTRRLAEPFAAELMTRGLGVTIDDRIDAEPTVARFEELLRDARAEKVGGVVGIGGGSVLDAAKLVAALVHDGAQPLSEVIGIGKLSGRRAFLACAPTTSGTGSEASPNAILLDEEKQAKVAAISPWLVPDVAIVDPLLTVSMPPAITAMTGVDALAHCMEAYTNRFAHPLIDHYALEGIRLAGASLARAVARGDDLEARTMMARASWYGGVCLGPVNTAAVHALAYPLGSEFGVAHGLGIALLLAAVMAFNLESAPERYAQVAVALGVPSTEGGGDARALARAGVTRVRELVRACGLPSGLGAIGISPEAVPALARGALAVTRLLKNNPRTVTEADAEAIYRASWGSSEAAA